MGALRPFVLTDLYSPQLQSLQKELQDAKRKSDETMKMAHRADVGNSTLDWYKSKLEEAKSEIEGLKKKLKGREDGEFDDREEAAGEMR